MKRKNYWFLFAILLLSLTSLSPSFEFTKNIGNHTPGKDPIPPSQTPDTPESDLGPIQIAVQLNGKELDKLKQMNEAFMKETGAVVEIIPLESLQSSEAGLMGQMNLGEGPDVLLVDSQWINSLAVKGYLLPIDASQTVVPDSQLLGGLLPPVQWNGYQWGIPFDMDPYVLLWSPDGDQSELPSNRKDWLNYKNNNGDRPVFALDPEDPYAFASVVSTLGGDPTQPNKEVISMLAPPAGDSWMNFTDTKGVTTASPETSEGGSASVVIGPYSLLGHYLPEGSQLTLVSNNSNSLQPIIKSRSFAVTAQSESSSLAMAWIAKMTSKDAVLAWTEATGNLSALSIIDNYTDSAINHSEMQRGIIDQVTSMMEHDEAVRLNFGRDDGFGTYSSSVRDLLHGRMKIKEFLEQYKTASP